MTSPHLGVGEGPVLLLAAPGADVQALLSALLAAPGTWDASSAFAAWADSSGDQEGQKALAASVRRTRGQLDWSRLPGDATPRMLAVVPPEPAVLALVPEALVLYLHTRPGIGIHASREAAEAWLSATEAILALATELPEERRVVTSVDSLLDEPTQELQRVLAELGLGWHGRVSATWREHVGSPVSRPTPGTALDEVVGRDVAARLESLDGRARQLVPEIRPSLLPTTPEGSLTATDQGLAPLLRRLGSSLLVSTYQTNRVISVRAVPEGLGVHLRAFPRPMGMAVMPGGLAISTRAEVLEYRDVPKAAAMLEPKGQYDACFLPRNSHVTGDIAVHDLALGKDGLWVVATRFSCLATLDAQHSFVPRWKPPFVSALAPEDRCHLNGLAVVDGVPRFATALGVSDEAGGWRADKASGGVLLQVPDGEVLASGLSMPHSPRWYDGRLWLLESGRGRLVEVDPTTGSTSEVAELPGFTRGLGFHGPYAFVGTSQVRETATFGGLPVAERGDLVCGVWAIDLRSGRVAASVRFEDRVQELFEVAVLPGVTHPEVAEWGGELARSSWSLPSPRV